MIRFSFFKNSSSFCVENGLMCDPSITHERVCVILGMRHDVTWVDNDDRNAELINFRGRINKIF